MIRFILRLFGITDFEPCKSCEILKQQIEFEREEKKQLTETLINILQPKLVEAPTIPIEPIKPHAITFSQRRQILEARDREEARIKKNSEILGKPDDALKDIEKLEEELGVDKEKMNG